MRVSSNTDIVLRGLARNAVTPACRIEKSCPASPLHQEPRQPPQTGKKPLPRIQVELVSQGGTSAFDPSWDGPRLRPAFVAQVMGQLMPERRASVALETAYGSARVGRMALLLDRRS